MSDKATYAQLLRHPNWQRKRLEIYERDNFACRFCRDQSSNLQVHHKRYQRDRLPWEAPSSDLITLCEKCHERVTALKRQANDLLADLNVYELPVVVAMLERMIHGERHEPVSDPSLDDDRRSLAAWDMETTYLFTGPFSRDANRRMGELESLTEAVWERLTGSAA